MSKSVAFTSKAEWHGAQRAGGTGRDCDKAPSIVLLQEYWGHQRPTSGRGRIRLAKEGFLTFTPVDLYHGRSRREGRRARRAS